MYDAIVVGARCAGSPTAMLLARMGHRVLLVDRAAFPSDTVSTHVIATPGLAHLKKWGLYERILATNCPEIERRTLDVGDFPLTGAIPRVDGLPSPVCARRTVLDKILVDAAAEAGAEVREAVSVQEILIKDDRVAGIRGRDRNGALCSELARIVIGADGKHSCVAQAAAAPFYKEVPPLMCWYYSYWAGIQDGPPTSGHYTRNHRKMLVFPTNDSLTMVLVGWPHGEFPRVRRNIEHEYRVAADMLSPELGEWLGARERVERFFGMADLPNFFRRPYGPGWALVGDAGHHKDPVVAHGISNAFRDAGLIAEAIHAGLCGERPMEDALAEYETRRNDAAFPWYEQTVRSASFTPPSDDELRLRAALRDGEQSDIDLYMSVRAGAVPRAQLHNPETLARIFRKSERRMGPTAVSASDVGAGRQA
jgi:flavin-dependent dehydrogenase